MFNSLKFKITITAFFIISAIMTLSTWRDINETERLLLEGHREKAALLSDRIAHSIMVLMTENRGQDMQALIESLVRGRKELERIRILRPEDGLIVVSSEPEEIGKVLKNTGLTGKPDAPGGGPGRQEYVSRFTAIKNRKACHACHDSRKDVLGILAVDISLDDVTASLREFKKEHFREALVGFLLIMGAFTFVAGVLIDRPIRKMIGTIRKIEKGDLSARMDENKKDEFGLVAKSFNRMLETLESAKKEIETYHDEQMQRAAKLASLGEIVSGIAHEIKNPLAGISCAVQVLQSEMDENDGRRVITGEILHHIKRLDRTLKDLLNYAKPRPPRFVPSSINNVLDKAVFFVYPEANKQKVVIETEIADNIPAIMMDPDQMQQIFLNLIINAVQAMPDGGKLTITVSEKDKDEIDEHGIRIPETGRVLAVKFEDTGKGIEGEHIDRIFDPFFTKKSKGTGLGLSISRRIIQEHGGDIAVKSEVGKGSIFTVYLPLER